MRHHKPKFLQKLLMINTNNHKFHKPDCSAVNEMKVSNRKNTDKARDELIAEGYTPCGKCKP